MVFDLILVPNANERSGYLRISVSIPENQFVRSGSTRCVRCRSLYTLVPTERLTSLCRMFR